MSYAWLQHLLIDVIPTPVDCVTTIGLSLHLLTIERADLLTQLRQTMAQQGTHRRALHPQNLGDLLKAALLIIAPDDHLALPTRQLANGFRQSLQNLLHGQIVGPLIGRVHRRQGFR